MNGNIEETEEKNKWASKHIEYSSAVVVCTWNVSITDILSFSVVRFLWLHHNNTALWINTNIYSGILYDTVRDVARHIRIRKVHFNKSLITLPNPAHGVQCTVNWNFWGRAANIKKTTKERKECCKWIKIVRKTHGLNEILWRRKISDKFISTTVNQQAGTKLMNCLKLRIFSLVKCSFWNRWTSSDIASSVSHIVYDTRDSLCACVYV